MAGEHIPRQSPICTCGRTALSHRPGHTPRAWPICTCGAKAEYHRTHHKYQDNGGKCLCGLPQTQHISRGGKHSRGGYRIDYVGIDGEGLGRRPHRYVLICAGAPDGRRWALEDINGLSSRAILKWILDTLYDCRVFSYGFGYDITHIIKDLPDKLIYDLLRPHRRYVRNKLKPVHWYGYSIDWLNGKFTVADKTRRVVIWDILKFYQQSFVKTLKDWELDIGDIAGMKEQRGHFLARDMPKIKEYCQDECTKTAKLAKMLITAHNDANLNLKTYFGPGSTANVMLHGMKVKDYQKDPPRKMQRAIASAFFGGRFEHSFMGIARPVYAYDISSAYPYHAYGLPCLRHGKWRHVDQPRYRELRDATTALVRYTYVGNPKDTWAPFPHRSGKGSITYPYRSSGWVWLPEYCAAIAGAMGEVKATEAWIYETSCTCQPFKDIAEHYRYRVELGKEGRGRVVKGGVNSVYGKLVQSKGRNPPYQNWIWGGLITSGTRAQVLDAIAAAQNPSDIIAIATDGVFSRTRLRLPLPRDTGTYDLKKPLGGWEETYHDAVLFLKPGVYLSLSDDITIKARGVGRRAMMAHKDEIIKAWEQGKNQFTIHTERFCGAKSCITPRRRTERFGQWVDMPITVKFECPNRRKEDMGLLARDYESLPYDPSLVTKEKIEIRRHQDMQYEQP